MFTREVNCKLFKCERHGNRQCCADCADRGTCLSRCENNPEKCGYGTVLTAVGGLNCPYFIKLENRSATERKRITCRGVIPGTQDIVCFQDEEARAEYVKKFCSGKMHKVCPLVKAQQRQANR